jgi:hypothetical protein
MPARGARAQQTTMPVVGFLHTGYPQLHFQGKPSCQYSPTTVDEHIETHRELGLKTEHFELSRTAFLDALREKTVTDAYSLDACRAILDPALAFMSDKVCHEAVKLAS